MGEGSINEVNKKVQGKQGDSGNVVVTRGEEIRSLGKSVRSGKQLSRNMDHFEMKVIEINEPSCLTMVECLGLLEINEVFVISEDLHWEGRTMEIVSPIFQGMDDGEEFSVIDIVVLFCRGEQLGKIGAWMPFSVGVGLEKDGSRHIF